MKKIDGKYLATFLLALLGTLSWTPAIYNSWCQNSEINGKILSNYANFGVPPNTEITQLIYVQKIVLFSKNKDFFPKEFKVFIKYPSIKKELECTLWIWRKLTFKLPENGKEVQKKLNINLSDYIIHKIVFPKNESIVGFISFSVNNQKDEKFEYIRYEFIDFNNDKKLFTIYDDEMKSNILVHEDNIWSN
jgi:hypothetical protein